jgi:hypothetical protein
LSFKINPLNNGIHSLAESLKAFKKFHDNPNDIFALKASIMYSHHALETIFKHFLYLTNPVFLLEDNVSVKRIITEYEKFVNGKNATPLNNFQTIDLKDVLFRLKKFKLLEGLEEKEYFLFVDAVTQLTFYRNKIQHFALSASIEEIGRILGSSLPKVIDIYDILSKKFVNQVFLSGSILNELENFYSESTSVLELLRKEYDILVQEAVQFFKGRVFNKEVLKLKIDDFGSTVSGTYLPELQADGFIIANFDHSTLIDYSFKNLGSNEMPYSASINITPTRANESDGLTTTEGTLDFAVQISSDKAEGILRLSNTNEKIKMLRRILINIQITLNYQAEGLVTPHHYNCEKVLKASGRLNIVITVSPKGFESQENQLIASYQSDIDETNTFFRLHAFREPNGTLTKNHTLEWNLETTGDLQFIK